MIWLILRVVDLCLAIIAYDYLFATNGKPMGRSGKFLLKFLAGLVVLSLGIVIYDYFFISHTRFYTYHQLNGKAAPTRLGKPPTTSIADFDHGSRHRLGVLVTDTSENWLGLARAFKAAGIPFSMTEDPARALQHQVVVVYPSMTGADIKPETARALAAHVHAGGTVVSFDMEGLGLEPLFGIKAISATHSHEAMIWATPDPETGQVSARFSRRGKDGDLGSYTLMPTTAQTLARYADGGAAMTCNKAVGLACLVGVDIGALASHAIDGRADAVSDTYDNHYDPSLDVFINWIKQLYVREEPLPWLIDTTPPGKSLSIIFTHDLDYSRSVDNADTYARLEHDNGVSATYFMQTKYIKDYNDVPFLTDVTIPELKTLLAYGMEIGSHSVAHSRQFASFPIGDGTENYPDYRPYVFSKYQTDRGTILGELRVSKFLLEQLVGAHISSFRPGYLAYPVALPELLHATGYAFTSSVTANVSLSHLPHQMSLSRSGMALVPVYEFPVTIEDEEVPKLDDRYAMEMDVLEHIARQHGLAVILIHPNIIGQKFDFEKRVIAAWKAGAWMTNLDTYGRWWRARDRAEIDVSDTPGGPVLSLSAPEAVSNLRILLPKAARRQIDITQAVRSFSAKI
ncbi:MAG: polysaccharide deacetylase family protein [Alphaproteobacteria bacterium]|nr:polysaccharide deacetylase family protein [Alphaproteobacteria bacterium]